MGIALALFVLRFDANQYRSLIESKVSETLGVKAEIGNLALGWRSGLALGVEGIRLQSVPGEVPFFETESLFVQFDPFLLMRGKLILSKLSLVKPNVLLVRRGDGRVNWPRGAGKGGSREARAAGLVFLLSDLRVQGGNLSYRDEALGPVQGVNLEGLEARLTQTLPGGPVSWNAEGKISSTGRVSDVRAEGRLHPRDGRIEFAGQIFQDRVILSGEARLFDTPPQYQGKLEVRGLDTKELFVPRGGEVSLSGLAHGELTFEGRGRDAEALKKSLRGEGQFLIQDGAFRNLNVVDAVLSRITPIPALRGVLLGVVPIPYQPLLQSRDTSFRFLRGKVSIEDGQVSVPSLAMEGADYLVEARGNVNFEKDARFRARLVLREPLSEFFRAKVHEISLLSNSRGELVIPFIYQGKWPSARPQPDVGYLAQQLVVEQGSQLLEKGLEVLAGLREKGKI